MTRQLSIAALVLSITGVAGAQPAPAGQTPTGSDAGSAAAGPPTEETPPGVKPEEPKDDKPAVLAKYDNGTKLYTEDDQFELKLQFRNQMRFEATRPLEDGSQFLDRFYIV